MFHTYSDLHTSTRTERFADVQSSNSELHMDIVQHHPQFDLEALFKDIHKNHISSDFNDLDVLTRNSSTFHSFISRTAEWKDRVYNAIGFLFDEEDFTELLIKSKAVYLIVLTDNDAERRLTIDEVQRIGDFASGLPEECEFIWTIHHQAELGNAVKVVVIIGE